MKGGVKGRGDDDDKGGGGEAATRHNSHKDQKQGFTQFGDDHLGRKFTTSLLGRNGQS